MSGATPQDEVAVVLVGHGAPATDCPPQLVGELMQLEWRAGAHASADGSTTGAAREGSGVPQAPAGHSGPPASASERYTRMRELDATIRSWPRHAGNDPYKVGLEQVAATLRPLLPVGRLVIGYGEFCQPSIEEAVAGVIRDGARRVLVIPSMLTPGGLHSEHDIPRALACLRTAHPEISIEYLWPFDLHAIATLLASPIHRALGGVLPSRTPSCGVRATSTHRSS